MKRYHLVKQIATTIPGTGMQERDDGEWVRYADVKHLIEPTAEADANIVLGVPLLLEHKGCNCCGGKLVFIRGKYPKDEQREICPTCAYERLEEIHRISDANYNKTYCSNSNGT